MNSVQAIMLTSAPVDSSMVMSSSSSKSASQSLPVKGGFAKQFKKACQAQWNNSTQSGERQETSESIKTESDNRVKETQCEAKDKPQDKANEKSKDSSPGELQSADSSTDEGQDTEQTDEANNQTGNSTSIAMTQAMNMVFVNPGKTDDTVALQQTAPAAAIETTAIAKVTAELSDFYQEPLANTSSDASQTTNLPIDTGDTNKKGVSTSGQAVEEKNGISFVLKDADPKAPVKILGLEQKETKGEPGQTSGKLEANGLELQDQIKDDSSLKKTEGETSKEVKKLTEFESQRVSVIRLAKDNSSSEGQDQSSSSSEDKPNSEVLQHVEVEIPKLQMRNATSIAQNSQAVVDPKELMSQVVKKAEVMLKDNTSQMTLQLKPDFLGKMTIKISIDDAGTVTARFTTSSQQVKNILEQNIQALRQTLEAQGMKVDKTEVNVQLDSGGMMNDQGGRQDSWQQPRGNTFIGLSTSEVEPIEPVLQTIQAINTGGYQSGETGDSLDFLV